MTLPSCFSFHNVRKCPFPRIFSSYFLPFEGVFVFYFAVSNVPEAECQIAAYGSKFKNAVLCIIYKMHVRQAS